MVLLGALVLAAPACQDMDVTNPNNPGRDNVLKSGPDVESLISTAFREWFNRTEGTSPAVSLSFMADEFTGGFFDFGGQELSREPREPLNPRSGTNPSPATWVDYYRIIAGINTAFRAIEENDLTILDGGVDVTMRAKTFGRFMQGLSHAHLALLFDQGYVSSEVVDFGTLTFEGAAELIRPYTEIRDTALAQLKAALALAQANTFTLPGSGTTWIPGITMTNQDLARLINTYIARLMVYAARSPQERTAVNWNEVIQRIDAGITSDFTPVAIPDVMESVFKHRAGRQRTTTPGDFMRVDYMTVGPADQGQGWVNWVSRDWSQRTPFRMTNVQDRRIDGLPAAERPGTCSIQTTSCGLYMGYHVANVWNADRGTGQRSYYIYHRYGTGTSHELGPIVIINMAELDLLKAEGLIRLGRAAEAIPLINKTRVANGGLPPVDINGAPGTAPDCTPRKRSGACGSLWDALRYEKRIETLGVEGGPAFFDARGWQGLVENTLLHFPMRFTDLELLQMPIYTTGGGQPGSAPAPDVEKCPVALPRC